jgi:hypothetical protein
MNLVALMWQLIYVHIRNDLYFCVRGIRHVKTYKLLLLIADRLQSIELHIVFAPKQNNKSYSLHPLRYLLIYLYSFETK